jgi:uncharacterized protein (TIGR02145 family)
MKNKITLISFLILFFAMYTIAQEKGTFTDSRDSKSYKTVKIGTQIWMAENLAYKIDIGCWANNDDQENVAIFGYLYNWETAKQSCPTGWHLPSSKEWQVMIDFLGGDIVAGGKLKETGTTHWSDPNTGATNETGFAALPGGERGFSSSNSAGFSGLWWSSTAVEDEDGYAFLWQIYSTDSAAQIDMAFQECGLSVRCIKD